jgi:hypothetical protein
MGLPMAMNLQRHLSKTAQTNLTYYNRTIASGKPLQDLGAMAATNLLELVDKCNVIFTMVRILHLPQSTLARTARLTWPHIARERSRSHRNGPIHRRFIYLHYEQDICRLLDRPSRYDRECISHDLRSRGDLLISPSVRWARDCSNRSTCLRYRWAWTGGRGYPAIHPRCDGKEDYRMW